MTPNTDPSRRNAYSLYDYVGIFVVESYPDLPLQDCDIYRVWNSESPGMQRQLMSTTLTVDNVASLVNTAMGLDDGENIYMYMHHVIEIIMFMCSTMHTGMRPRQINFGGTNLRLV